MKSTAEVAESLGISTRRVTKLIEDGILKAQKIGRSWFIDESSIEAFAKAPRKSGRPRKSDAVASVPSAASAAEAESALSAAELDSATGAAEFSGVTDAAESVAVTSAAAPDTACDAVHNTTTSTTLLDTAVNVALSAASATANVAPSVASAAVHISSATQKNLTGAQALIRALEDAGVEFIFGLPGAQVLDIYDALYSSKRLRHILVRHEQGAVHAADAYARVSGKCGTVLVTSGPGATNTVTGIAAAYMDSVPVVVICGQVPTEVLGSDAFQESDITGITMPVVKHSFLLKSAAEIPKVVAQAYHIANTGRPGPVVIDVPSSVAKSVLDNYAYPKEVIIDSYRPTLKGHAKQINLAAKNLVAAKRPVVLVGGGIIKSQASKELRECVNLLDAPITCTMLGKGAFPENSENYLGVAGIQSSAVANAALQQSDLVLAIGTRFADRVTGNPKAFVPVAKVIHIDIDPAEISKNIHADIPIVGDAKIVLQALNAQLAACKKELSKGKDGVENSIKANHDVWKKYIQELKVQQAAANAKQGDSFLQNIITPRKVLSTLDALCKKKQVVFTTEVGQHQMWAANYLKCSKPRTFLTSGGAGVMGYGLPATIGAALASPTAQIICIAGDGSLQMNVQEMATITELGLPVKVLLFNNKGLGMVHELQATKYNCRYCATEYSYNPDFAALARAYGWEAFCMSKLTNIDNCADSCLSQNAGMDSEEATQDLDKQVLPSQPPLRTQSPLPHQPPQLQQTQPQQQLQQIDKQIESQLKRWLECSAPALLEVDISMGTRTVE